MKTTRQEDHIEATKARNMQYNKTSKKAGGETAVCAQQDLERKCEEKQEQMQRNRIEQNMPEERRKRNNNKNKIGQAQKNFMLEKLIKSS
jgi:hypothetical protein